MAKTPKIVVVDDSEFTRQSIVDILQEEGFDVVGQAESAEKAAKFLSTDANVYLIDIVMPQASGLELAKLLIEQKNSLKLIMMSSLKTEGIVVESISNGASDYIQKPFTRETLLQSVRKIESILRGDK